MTRDDNGKNQGIAARNAAYCTGRNDGFAAGLLKATQLCERRADSLVEGAAVARQCAADSRALIETEPDPLLPQEPTDLMVSVCLQTFRREIDIHMDTKHPSSSPGHDSMRIALRAMLTAMKESRGHG